MNTTITGFQYKKNVFSNSMCCLTIIACLVLTHEVTHVSLIIKQHQTAEIWARMKRSAVESMAEVCWSSCSPHLFVACGYWRERGCSSHRGALKTSAERSGEITTSCPWHQFIKHDGVISNKCGCESEEPIRRQKTRVQSSTRPAESH